MNEDEGFVIVPNPNKAAREWFELYRAGKFEEAAAQSAEEQRRSKEATRATVQRMLKAREDSRR